MEMRKEKINRSKTYIIRVFFECSYKHNDWYVTKYIYIGNIYKKGNR